MPGSCGEIPSQSFSLHINVSVRLYRKRSEK